MPDKDYLDGIGDSYDIPSIDYPVGEIQTGPITADGGPMVATDMVNDVHFMEVVLREDQLEKIATAVVDRLLGEARSFFTPRG